MEQGFAATTASIAVRAGVSEGTLFKRFSTKEDLFAAALGLTDYGVWRAGLLDSVGQGEVQRNLERAALALLDEANERIQNLMAVFSRGTDPSHNPMMQKLNDPGQGDENTFMRYLQAEMELGRIRPLDAGVSAVVLAGALAAFTHRECMPRPLQEQTVRIDRGRFVRGLMDVLWPGIKP